MATALPLAIHVLTAAALPPLLLGVIGKTKALFAGRVGPPLLQPYYDLAKLFRKGSVFSTTATWVFRAGPVVGVATAALATFLIPLGNWPAPVSFAGVLVLLAENCRIPFDDPNTHLELTMIHEVMVLDHGGPAFGLVLYGAALKLFAFAALLVGVALPIDTGRAWADWGVFVAAVLGVAVLVGVTESVMARLRLVHV